MSVAEFMRESIVLCSMCIAYDVVEIKRVYVCYLIFWWAYCIQCARPITAKISFIN